jgi:hypothetical protein
MSLLNCLCSVIPARERVVTCEEVFELGDDSSHVLTESGKAPGMTFAWVAAEPSSSILAAMSPRPGTWRGAARSTSTPCTDSGAAAAPDVERLRQLQAAGSDHLGEVVGN